MLEAQERGLEASSGLEVLQVDVSCQGASAIPSQLLQKEVLASYIDNLPRNTLGEPPFFNFKYFNFTTVLLFNTINRIHSTAVISGL